MSTISFVVTENTIGFDYHGVIDSWMQESAPANTNGGSATLTLSHWQTSTTDINPLLLAATGLPVIPGAVVTAATLSLWFETYNLNGTATTTANAYALLRNWVEAQVSANEWSTGNSWTTLGAAGAGTDRASSSSGTLTLPLPAAVGAYWNASLPSGMLADIQAIIDGTAPSYGWVFPSEVQAFGDERVFTSSQGADGRRPKLSVTASAPPTITAQPTEQTAAAGGTATFSVTATTNTSGLTYQWHRISPGGTDTTISGATSSSYTTGTLSRATDGGALYYCVVSDAEALPVNTVQALLRVTQYPTSPSGLGLVIGAGAIGDGFIGGPITVGALTLTLAAAVASAAALNRGVGSIKSAATGSSALRSMLVARAVAATTAGVATVARAASLVRTSSQSSAGVLAAIRTKLLNLQALVGSAAVATRAVQMARAAASTSAATLRRSIAIVRAATVGASATASAIKTKLLTLSAAAAAGAALVRSVGASRIAPAAASANVLRTVGGVRAAVQASASAVARGVSATRGVTQSCAATITSIKAKLMSLSAVSSSSAAVARAVQVVRSATTAPLAAITKRTATMRSAAQAASAAAVRMTQALRSAVQTSAASATSLRARGLVLLAAVGQVVSLRRAISVTRSASGGVAGAVRKALARTVTASSSVAATCAAVFQSSVSWLDNNAEIWTVAARDRFVRIAARVRAWRVTKR